MPGGRPKGALGKPKRQLLALLQERFGNDWHPVVKMADMAEDESNPKELRAQMYKEVSQYVAPKLKAVQHTGPGGGPVAVAIEEPMTTEQWAEHFSK